MFTCTKCKINKQLTEYHIRNATTRGHDSWCKSCKSEYRKQYFLDNKDKESKRGRIKAWKSLAIDISYETYEQMNKELGGACQICETTTQTLNVDHSHETGKIRGLLCGSCNRGIGLLKDSPEILKKAIEYLNDHALRAA